jgi:alpha-glucosidase
MTWWQRGIIYHIYPRSFMDSNGDSTGDLPGIIRRLDYLEWLGVDAIWISPIFPSPMADFGYDVSDYTSIDLLFGTLDDFDRLLADAHRRGLDHALDHLNQIDQWLAWQRDGVVPTPTDGWVGSSVTLPGDLLPLSSSDLDAWLWRVDQAARLVRQRASELTEAELDWQPPDGGWPLRRVLHHLARSERLYAASIDEALPGNDPTGR